MINDDEVKAVYCDAEKDRKQLQNQIHVGRYWGAKLMAYVLKTDFLKDFPKHRTFGQRDGQAKGVCIHNAAATTGARNLGIYGNYNSPEVSYHFSVDEAEAYHLIPLDWTAWHAGERNGNLYYIAIEIGRDMDYDTDLYDRAEANAAELAAWILQQLGLPANDDTLKRHYDFNKKMCPHRMFEVEAGKTSGRSWEQFRQLVKSLMAKPKPEPEPEPKPDLVWLEAGTEIRDKPTREVEISTRYTIVERRGKWGRLKAGGWVKLPEGTK